MKNHASECKPTLREWLECSPIVGVENGVNFQGIHEKRRPQDLIEFLAREIRDARFSPDLLADYADLLGVEWTEGLVDSLVPKGMKIRRGYFGEVVSAICLRDFDGCWLPISKLRSMISSDQSLPGVDVLGAHLVDHRIEALVFVESKLRTYRDTRVAFDAAKELIKDFQSQYPSILHTAAAQLLDTGDPMYRPFLDYLKRRDIEDTEDLPYVYLLIENGKWSDADIEALEDLSPLPKGFRVSVIEIDQLAELVELAYSSIGFVVDENDDE